MPRPSADSLPEDLPVPIDDGACDHLRSARMPKLPLPSTSGGRVDLSAARGTTVVYVYPHTGRPDHPTPREWDRIPGARGCTPEACGFRDHHPELRALGVSVYGVSTDETEWQREAVSRLRLPFELLSDERLTWTRALDLPSFEFRGRVHLKRLTIVLDDDRTRKVFYPIFPPDRHAAEVVAYLASTRETP